MALEHQTRFICRYGPLASVNQSGKMYRNTLVQNPINFDSVNIQYNTGIKLIIEPDFLGLILINTAYDTHLYYTYTLKLYITLIYIWIYPVTIVLWPIKETLPLETCIKPLWYLEMGNPLKGRSANRTNLPTRRREDNKQTWMPLGQAMAVKPFPGEMRPSIPGYCPLWSSKVAQRIRSPRPFPPVANPLGFILFPRRSG